MTARCPHCAGDVAEDAAVQRRGWWLHPGGAFRNGVQFQLTRTQTRVLYAIARADGQPVTHEAIDGVPGPAALTAHVRAIRKVTGDHFPVEATNRGFVWCAAA